MFVWHHSNYIISCIRKSVHSYRLFTSPSERMATTVQATDRLTLSAAAEFACYPPSKEQSCWAIASLRAPLYEPTSRSPVDIAAVIDKSGSMRGTKLDLVKKTLLFVIDQCKYTCLWSQELIMYVLSNNDTTIPLPHNDATHTHTYTHTHTHTCTLPVLCSEGVWSSLSGDLWHGGDTGVWPHQYD